MGYGPFGKPTTVSIERYQRLENDFNELLIEHKNLVEVLDKYKNLMERTHQKTYSSLDEDFYQVIEETKERLNKFIKA